MNSVNLYLQDKIDVETVRPIIQRIIDENALLEVDKESSADLMNLYITNTGQTIITNAMYNIAMPSSGFSPRSIHF